MPVMATATTRGSAASFEAADGRSEEKGQREGEGERDEQIAGEEEDEDGDGEHEKGRDPGELGGSSCDIRPRGAVMEDSLVRARIHQD